MVSSAGDKNIWIVGGGDLIPAQGIKYLIYTFIDNKKPALSGLSFESF
jgi:hypothetical protein